MFNKIGSCKGVNGESVKERKEKKERWTEKNEIHLTYPLTVACRRRDCKVWLTRDDDGSNAPDCR